MLKTVNQVRVELSFKLLAFAIMPDHLHLIVVPPEDGPAKMMQLIKGRFSRTYGGLTACAEPVWQSRYHERILTTEQALFSAIEYVHNNPVASRLVGQPEDYRWSSAGAEWKTDLEQFFRSG